MLDDNPRIHHDKGFDSSITRSHAVGRVQAGITTLPRGTEFKVDNTQQGQVAMIAPTILEDCNLAKACPCFIEKE